MKATEKLHQRGQSLWLDNITRSMLDNGIIARFISDYSVTGHLEPLHFRQGDRVGRLRQSHRLQGGSVLSDEALFFELAVEDLQRAADLFDPSSTAPTG